MKFVVIGAGPTALGFLYRMHELGRLRAADQVVLLERSGEVGGLAHSVQDSAGFWWDMGGHVTFSHYHYFSRIIDEAITRTGNGWSECTRASYVHLQNRFIGYPLQNNVHCLDEPERSACIAGLADKPRLKPANFDEWIVTHFGAALAELFMRPYNRKVWTVDPREMNHVWVGERVAVPTVEEIRAKLERGGQDTGWGPNATFRFPLHGGTGAIWNGIAQLLPSGCIHLRNAVTSVALNDRQLSVTDSVGSTQTLNYDVLVNTAPLDLFLPMISDADPSIKELAGRFVHNKVHVVGIGLRGTPPPELRDKTWMYFPDPAVPFYRMTVFSNYSPYNAPPGCWSVMVECSEPMGPVRFAADEMIDMCVQALARLDFIQPDRIVSRFHRRLDRGYPVPFLKRDESLDRVNGYLAPFNVYSRGRFGGWRYEVANQDHSFMQGVELVDSILFGVPELTYPSCDYVNARVRPGRTQPLPMAASAASTDVVVAHYKENLDWLKEFKHLAHVYHKGGQPERYDFKQWERLPNVGRESHTYLHHIVANYDHLAEVTVFLQGAVGDHLPAGTSLRQLLEPAADIVVPRVVRLREWGNDGRIMHFGIWKERLEKGLMRPSPVSLVDWFRTHLDLNPAAAGSILYMPGAVLAVKKECILRRPRAFYRQLLETVGDHHDPEEGHYLERSWLYIFGSSGAEIRCLDAA